MKYLLSTNGLTKQYGRNIVLDHVSLHIPEGEVYCLMGQNGAGKTTLLRLISGLAAPTSGEITLFGETGLAARRYVSRIGILIDSPGFYPSLTVLDNLKMMQLACGTDTASPEDLLWTPELRASAAKPVRRLPAGVRQCLGISLALVCNPDLLLLDEPLKGLDPQSSALFRDLIRKLVRERGVTVLVSSHRLAEFSRISTRYGILHNGALLREITAEELRNACGEHLMLKTSDAPLACTVLEQMGIRSYRVVDAGTINVYERIAESAAIIETLVLRHIPLSEAAVKKTTLENYYLNLIGGNADA